MYSFSTDKYTYYIFPNEKVIQVSNENKRDISCSGFDSVYIVIVRAYSNSIVENQAVTIKFQHGDYCPGHRFKSTSVIHNYWRYP